MTPARSALAVHLAGGCDVTIRRAPYADPSLRSVARILQTTALALVAAGIAALAFALVSLLWFVVGVVVSGALALIAEVVARRGARRTKREDAAQAHAARLAELTRKADALKARERAVERAQMEVLEGFRREYGL